MFDSCTNTQGLKGLAQRLNDYVQLKPQLWAMFFSGVNRSLIIVVEALAV